MLEMAELMLCFHNPDLGPGIGMSRYSKAFSVTIHQGRTLLELPVCIDNETPDRCNKGFAGREVSHNISISIKKNYVSGRL